MARQYKLRTVDRTGMLMGPIGVVASAVMLIWGLWSESAKLAEVGPAAYGTRALVEGGNVLAVAVLALLKVLVGAIGVWPSRGLAFVIGVGAVVWFVRGVRVYRAKVAADRSEMGLPP
jgi:hypothetical protein